jgi:hypothetical protein
MDFLNHVQRKNLKNVMKIHKFQICSPEVLALSHISLVLKFQKTLKSVQ